MGGNGTKNEENYRHQTKKIHIFIRLPYFDMKNMKTAPNAIPVACKAVANKLFLRSVLMSVFVLSRTSGI